MEVNKTASRSRPGVSCADASAPSPLGAQVPYSKKTPATFYPPLLSSSGSPLSLHQGRGARAGSGGWGLVCRGPSGEITLPAGSAWSLGSPAGWGPAASSRSGLIAHSFLAPLCPLPYSPLPARRFWNHLPNKLLTLQSLFPACPAASGITIDVESQPH